MAEKKSVTAKPIILLSGPPGAGKTTIAKELVTISPGPIACIEGDKFWSFFAKGWEGKGQHKNFVTLMTSVTAASLSYARAGYEVILDFSIPPWFLPTVHKIITSRGMQIHYVVLRPARDTCALRAAGRSEGAVVDYGHLDEFYESFAEAGPYIVSDDDCSPAEMAALIREGQDKGMFKVKL
jgi:chloramphenicol 3-O-phosphotransferase